MTHQDELEAYNAGWNAGRWDEPRNCPYFDRTRVRSYVEGYNDGKRYAATGALADAAVQP